MDEIPGYVDQRELFSGESTIVYRAVSLESKQPVVLKTCKDSFPPAQVVHSIQREYNKLRSVRVDGIVQAYGLVYHQNKPVLVLEDIDGISLDHIIEKKRFSVELFLRLSIRIAGIMADLHDAGLLHGAIGPENIIWNARTGQIRLIDFSSAQWITSVFSYSIQHETPPQVPSVYYMSPEQSGRIRAAVDHRSDYYSFGITLYEMLMGFPPFQGKDHDDIIRQHLTKVPFLPNEINEEIPPILSQIIHRMIAKNPEDRYQTDHGLISDLEECFTRLGATGIISEFPIGENDSVHQFKIPEKLIGREELIREATDYFTNEKSQAGQVLLVRGASGAGKTSLVHEVIKRLSVPLESCINIHLSRQKEQTSPEALISGVEGFLDWFYSKGVTEKDFDFLDQRKIHLKNIFHEGSIASNPLPNGEVAAFDDFSDERRNAYAKQFLEFIQEVLKFHAPLTIVFENIHLADSLLIQILQALLASATENRVRLLLTERTRDQGQVESENGISPVEQWPGHTPLVLNLNLLNLDEVNEFLCEVFRGNEHESLPLARIIYHQTSGNPLFIVKFLRRMMDEGLVRYNRVFRRWIWDMGEIKKIQFVETLDDLIQAKIGNYSEILRVGLQTASVIGERFDPGFFATLLGINLIEAIDLLKPAVNDGILEVDAETYTNDSEDLISQVRYSFSHSRMYEAIYDSIPEDQKRKLHEKIGNELMNQTDVMTIQSRQKLFEIVRHFNYAIVETSSPELILRCITLNQMAARKSREVFDYETSVRYYQKAIHCRKTLDEMKTDDPGRKPESDSEELFLEAAYTFALAGKSKEDQDSLIQTIVTGSKRIENRLKAMEIQIMHFRFTGQMQNAISGLIMMLGLLGETFSLNTDHTAARKRLSHWLEKNKDVEKVLTELLYREMVSDSFYETEIRILSEAASVAFLLAPDLYTILIIRTIEKLDTRGMTEYGVLALIRMAVLINSHTLDSETALAIGKEVLERTEQVVASSRVYHRIHLIYQDLIRPWNEPQRKILADLRNCYVNAEKTGDYHLSHLALFSLVNQSFLSGRIFHEVKADLDRLEPGKFSFRSAPISEYISVIRSTMDRMSRGDGPFVEDTLKSVFQLDENEHAQEHSANLLFLKEHLMVTYYVHFQQYEKALPHVLNATRYRSSARSMINGIKQVYYDSFVHVALYETTGENQKGGFRERIGKNQEVLKKRAESCPENFLHLFFHIEAEQTALEGRALQAMSLFDRAIQFADEHGFLNDSGFISQRAAQFYLKLNRIKIARTYLEDSIAQYRNLGATAVANHLSHEYSSLIVYAPGRYRNLQSHFSVADRVEIDRFVQNFKGIIKSSTYLLGEPEPVKIVQNILEILLGMTGGVRVVIALNNPQAEEWTIEADLDRKNGLSEVFQNQLLEKYIGEDRIPGSVFQYVIHTGETLVYEQAREEWRWSNDLYLSRIKEGSILCIPMRTESKTSGIIYIENDLTPGVFSKSGSRFIELMSDQLFELFARAKHHRKKLQEKTLASQNHVYHRKTNTNPYNIILFSEIVNIQNLIYNIPPEYVYNYTNKHLMSMEPIIRDNGGYIDRFIGDAIMAIFSGNTGGAIRTALQMKRETVQSYKENTMFPEFLPELGVGVLLIDPFNKSQQTDHQAEGSTEWIVQAEQLKNLARHFRMDVVISASMLFHLEDPTIFSIRFLGPFYMETINKTIPVYEIFDGNEKDLYARKAGTLELFDQSLNQFITGDYRSAASSFASVVKSNPDDFIARYYYEKATSFLNRNKPPHWQGIEL